MAAIDQVAALVLKWGPLIAEAFLASIAGIRSRIVLRRLIERIQAGDIDGAVEALNIEEPAFIEFEQSLRSSFIDYGTATAQKITRLGRSSHVVLMYNVRDPATELLLQRASSGLITSVTQEQKANVRQVLTDGMAQGKNPTQTAVEVVGRVSRATGKREGGIIGLSAQQVEYVASARDQLSSGDPVEMQKYLDRSDNTRDKRFDRTVEAAIRDGKMLDKATVEHIVTRYSDRLLKYRGDVISLNETRNSSETAKNDAYRQSVTGGKVSADAITKGWKHLANEHPRLQHIAMSGKKVGLDEVFILPDGTRMMYAHDPSAPAKHLIGCHCQTDYEIDFFAKYRQ